MDPPGLTAQYRPLPYIDEHKAKHQAPSGSPDDGPDQPFGFDQAIQSPDGSRLVRQVVQRPRPLPHSPVQ
jgi:hypothetical protein